MKRVIPLLLLLAIGGAVVYFHPQWFRKPTDENVLKLSGNIEAHESLVSFKVTGRIIDLPVDEGMTLKAGDLLARLDNDDYRQQVAVDESAIRVRNRQLALGSGGQPDARHRGRQARDARRSGGPRAEEEGLRALPGALRKGRNPGADARLGRHQRHPRPGYL